MYIRVSEILGRLQNFDAIDPDVLANKALIGTNVHNAILSDAVGDFPLIDSERAAAYFSSYLLFKGKERPKFLMQVPRLYDDELMITGEIDALIDGGGLPMLMDWKCSSQINEEIWGMQAHFYWYLLNVNKINIKPHFRWVQLRCKKHIELSACGAKIERWQPLSPKILDIYFDENVLSRCVDEAHKAWTEKKDCLILDF